jgi:alkylhydroperoxidase family enzyme
VSFHGTALRDEGVADEQIAAARAFDPDRAGFSPKERALFDFVMKVNGDPHSITDEDVEALRALGVTDAELVEAIETLNTGNNTNVFCDALAIGADPFLTYDMEGKRVES